MQAMGQEQMQLIFPKAVLLCVGNWEGSDLLVLNYQLSSTSLFSRHPGKKIIYY